MRYILAGIVSGFLIVGMFVFRSIMNSRIRIWARGSVDLSDTQILLYKSTSFISRNCLILVPCIIVVCFGVAVALPRKKKGNSD